MRSFLVITLRTLLTAAFMGLTLWGQAPAVEQAEAVAVKAARVLFRQGDFRGSAAAFQHIINIKDQPPAEAYSGLVESFLKLDDVKAAEESSQKALAALPGSAAAHAARADVYFRRGLVHEAEEEYKAALRLDDRCARAWLGRGKVDAVFVRR